MNSRLENSRFSRGPLIVNAGDTPIEYVTLTSPRHLKPDHAHALKDLHAMHKDFFGEGGRTFEHFHLMLELNTHNRRSTLRQQWGLTEYGITYARRGRQPLGAATYLTIALPRKLRGRHQATVSAPYDFSRRKRTAK